MKLKDCTIGTLVELRDGATTAAHVGHIVRLNIRHSDLTIASDCEPDEVIPVVKFVGEEYPRGIDPSNIRELQ